MTSKIKSISEVDIHPMQESIVSNVGGLGVGVCDSCNVAV